MIGREIVPRIARKIRMESKIFDPVAAVATIRQAAKRKRHIGLTRIG